MMLEGHLEAYWEQGMEGCIEYAFWVDEEDRLIFLSNGQFLRIFQDDQLLWEGTIEFVSRHGWFRSQQHHLPNPIWNDHTQKGVAYAKWIAWFWHTLKLRAELHLPA